MKFSDIYRGIIIVYPHGDFLINGSKKIIMKAKKYMDCVNKALLLIQDKIALGIIMINYLGTLNLRQFRKKYNLHKITEEERKKWWKNKKKLYQYEVTYMHVFHSPFNIDYPQGPQAFVKPKNIKMMQNIYIGTSGYDIQWFDVPKTQPLITYSDQYNTIELNSSFYKTPNENQIKKLFDETPKEFVFSIKINQSITHFGKLNDFHVSKFILNFRTLLPKIKCLLFQFPPHFKYNESNMNKLKNLSNQFHLYFAFEFRDNSWYNDDVFSLFKKNKKWTIVLSYNCENCFGRQSNAEGFNFDIYNFNYISNFLYIRMHGTEGKYIGSHKKYIINIVQFIRKSYNHGVTDVFTYFNNTDSLHPSQNIPDALYDVNYMNKRLFF